MKTRVSAPIEAAKLTGGCTFEPEIGWWTYSQQSLPAEVGKLFAGVRDALYIPTLQKTGEPVSIEAVEHIKATAADMGLTHLSCARGMWVLSHNGEVQVEVVWIAWAYQIHEQNRNKLADIARYIKCATNQDCVAWEQEGQLNFTEA